ncbi:MAG: hypothetical protein ACI381_03110 [Candidatus Methanomethylophilaceae archaeon]
MATSDLIRCAGCNTWQHKQATCPKCGRILSVEARLRAEERERAAEAKRLAREARYEAHCKELNERAEREAKREEERWKRAEEERRRAEARARAKADRDARVEREMREKAERAAKREEERKERERIKAEKERERTLRAEERARKEEEKRKRIEARAKAKAEREAELRREEEPLTPVEGTGADPEGANATLDRLKKESRMRKGRLAGSRKHARNAVERSEDLTRFCITRYEVDGELLPAATMVKLLYKETGEVFSANVLITYLRQSGYEKTKRGWRRVE